MILAAAIGIGLWVWALFGLVPAMLWMLFLSNAWLVSDRIALRQELERRCAEFNAWAGRQAIKGTTAEPIEWGIEVTETCHPGGGRSYSRRYTQAPWLRETN